MTSFATNPDAAPLDDEARTALIARGLEELLAEANLARHQAQMAERARNAFLGTISHEFRTPLTAVQGFADLLADGPAGALSEAQCRQVARIRAASDHLLGLIDEILGFAQNQAGRADLRLCAVDLADVARDVAMMVEPLAAAKELRFTPRIPAGPVPFHTDPGKFRQILLNLAANAVKFTGTGDVGMELEVVDDWVVLRVSDTGIGIAPGHVEQVFDSFWQVDQSSGRAGGTGLGLAVTRQLAALLEGEVTLQSELGHGSVFTVRLPPLSPPDDALPPAAPPAPWQVEHRVSGRRGPPRRASTPAPQGGPLSREG
ncbi:MAG TPA: HAMP domain-containing sensor histidine kinase [Longimicrobium sp.]|nr:HAMP domain-containing sensor histidine kinase [Longimicrobium sp.]